MAIVVSDPSQSSMDNVKLVNWSNNFIRSSSLAALLLGSWVAE